MILCIVSISCDKDTDTHVELLFIYKDLFGLTFSSLSLSR